MSLNIFGVEIPENLDSLNVFGTDIDELSVFGVLVWRKQKYYWVVYLGNGGTGSMPRQTLPAGLPAALLSSAFLRKGYIFKGWGRTADRDVPDFGETQRVTDIAAAGEECRLYALWRPAAYYVDYHGSGATAGNTFRSVHAYDSPKALNPNGFIRDNFRFMGWSGDGGSVVHFKNAQTVLNLRDADGAVYNLYAVWKGMVAADWEKDCSSLTGGIAIGTSNGDYRDNGFWEAWGRYGWGYISKAAQVWVCTKGMVDLTNVERIHFEVDCSYSHRFTAGVTQNFGLNEGGYAKAFVHDYYENARVFDVTLDVSELSGTYYIQTQAGQGVHNGYAGHHVWNRITLE